MTTNVPIEQSLLGEMLTDNATYDQVSDFLKAEHFSQPVHSRIYEAIGTVINKGQTATPARLRAHFEEDADLMQAGGGDYLMGLVDSAIPFNFRENAVHIFELWQQRSLTALAEDVVAAGRAPSVDISPLETIRAIEADLYEIMKGGPEDGVKLATDVAYEASEQITAAYKANKQGKIIGISTGIDALDRKTGGLRDGLLYVIAGATSMGKSGLAGTIADNAAREGKTILFASLEMSAEQNMTRTISGICQIPVNQLEQGNLVDSDMDKVVHAGMIAAKWPTVYDDRSDMSIIDLRGAARRQMNSGPLHMIVVDYLQLMAQNPGERYEGRTNEVSKITRGLKNLARELKLPVIAISQLSRKVEDRDDKRPRLSDLRESGSIEQDSDVVMFVFRDSYYLDQDKPSGKKESDIQAWEERKLMAEGKAEVIIAKQRQGATGRIVVGFDAKTTRFHDRSAEMQQDNLDMEGL